VQVSATREHTAQTRKKLMLHQTPAGDGSEAGVIVRYLALGKSGQVRPGTGNCES